MHGAPEEKGETAEAKIKALWDETVEFQHAIFAYCLARCAPSTQSNDQTRYGHVSATPSEREPLDAIIARLLDLLGTTDSISQMRARQIVVQSVALFDEVTRARRKSGGGENIVDFVPRSLHTYLEYSIASFFLRTRNRERITRRLNTAGIVRVGDLVQHPMAEIAEMLEHRASLNEVREKLAAVGLGFGMQTALWRRQRRLA